jgi:hypothetical protein
METSLDIFISTRFTLAEFISLNRENWYNEIKSAPYNISVTPINERDDIYILNYKMIPTQYPDFSYKFVRECRGALVKVNSDYTIEFICKGIDKHFNLSEPLAQPLDNYYGKPFTMVEKVDGSLIKLYWDTTTSIPQWNIMTNGSYHSDKVLLKDELSVSFKEISMKLLQPFFKYMVDELHTDYTYLFELVHPSNTIVVNYNQPSLYLIGMVNNKTQLVYDNEIKNKWRDILFYKRHLDKDINNIKIPFEYGGGIIRKISDGHSDNLNVEKSNTSDENISRHSYDMTMLFYNNANELNENKSYPTYEGFMINIYDNSIPYTSPIVNMYKVKSDLYLKFHYLANNDNSWGNLYEVYLNNDARNEFLSNPNISSFVKDKLKYISMLEDNIVHCAEMYIIYLACKQLFSKKDYALNRENLENDFRTCMSNHFNMDIINYVTAQYFYLITVILDKSYKGTSQLYEHFITNNKNKVLSIIKNNYKTNAN